MATFLADRSPALLESNLAELHRLWTLAEACAVRIEVYEDGPIIILEWTDGNADLHQPDFTTYYWHFMGDTIAEAAADALEWCRMLTPWKQCAACDGEGCYSCYNTGLADPPQAHQ